MNTLNEVTPRRGVALEAAQIKPARPPVYQSLLKILIAIGTGISLLLGLLEYKDIVPDDWMAGEVAVWVGAASGILFALKQFCEAIGDVLDDGIVNKSFKLMLLVGLLPWCLASCATEKMSQAQLTLADIGYTAAQGALIVAEASLAEKMADPKTPAWQRLSAQLAVTQARKTLTREQAKLDAAFAALLAGKVPAELSMPTYDGGKTALSVVP